MSQNQPTTMKVKETIRSYILHNILHKRNTTFLDFGQVLIEDGTLDSLSINKLAGFLETEFHIEISAYDMTLENFTCINSITSLISNKLQSKSKLA